MSFLVFFTSLAAGLGQSPFVDSQHEHSWLEIIAEADGKAWVDENWAGSVEFDQMLLPTILLRSVADDDCECGAGPTVDELDAIVAIDCSAAKIGIVRGVMHGETIKGKVYEEADPVEMVSAEEVDMSEILNVICARES